MSAQRILVVANRLPEVETDKGVVSMHNGCVLAAGQYLMKEKGKEVVWFGHVVDPTIGNPIESSEGRTPTFFDKDCCIAVPCPPEQIKGFYEYCKYVLWPLFHYHGNRGVYELDTPSWEDYKSVNRKFAETIIENYREGDVIFIQDYHLMLLPAYLRQKLPNAMIVLFIHIPWPSSELYRGLPVRCEVLEGILGADLVGFQTFTYARHFMSACTRLLGLTCNDKGVYYLDDRFVRTDVFPVGIEPRNILTSMKSPGVLSKIEEMKQAHEGKKVIVCRDRIEYIKGIPQKLKAFETFLTRYPEWQGKVILFMECRLNAAMQNEKSYRDLQDEVEHLVGSINGKFGTIQWAPIHYFNRELMWEEELALFSIADAFISVPLRDGMNLTSHEFICTQQDKMSPLVLSEFAGSAHCLSGALLVNPWDNKKVSKALHNALTMPEDQKKIRFRHNYDYVVNHDAAFWVNSLLAEIDALYQCRFNTDSQIVQKVNFDEISQAYRASKKRLFLLDYDGTLSPIAPTPDRAVPTEQLIQLLHKLTSQEGNYVYVVSGRDRYSLGEWLSGVPVGMGCEHGLFFKRCNKEAASLSPSLSSTPSIEWEDVLSTLDMNWKSDIRALFDDFADRTPGAAVEAKEVNLTWHYRNADPDFGEYQKKELLTHLHSLPSMPIDILIGKKCVEVRPQGINKGSVVRRILSNLDGFDFALCMGDDKTDEDMFEELKKYDRISSLFTVMIDKKPTTAMYYLENQQSALHLLETLSNS